MEFFFFFIFSHIQISVSCSEQLEYTHPSIVIDISCRFEKLLNEMLNHLERQPRNKQRRTAWLTHIEPLFNVLGLLLLAHFRRLFPLFFKWMHADDDETVLLVRQFLLYLKI